VWHVSEGIFDLLWIFNRSFVLKLLKVEQSLSCKKRSVKLEILNKPIFTKKCVGLIQMNSFIDVVFFWLLKPAYTTQAWRKLFQIIFCQEVQESGTNLLCLWDYYKKN